MILSKEVKIKLSNSTLKYYSNKGYLAGKQGDFINVKIDDLPERSAVEIKVKCDVCGIEKEVRFYNYKHTTKDGKSKYMCINCKMRDNIKTSTFGNNFDFENVINEFKSKGYSLISNKEDYQNKNTILSFTCDKHDSEVQHTTYKRMVESKSQCKFCKKKMKNSNLLVTVDDINNFLVSKNRKYTVKEIENNKSLIEISCNICGFKSSIKKTSVRNYTSKECLHQISTVVNKSELIKEIQSEIDKFGKKIKIIDLYYVSNSKMYGTSFCPEHSTIFNTAVDKIRKDSYLGCKKCISDAKSGKNNHNWNPDLTEEDRVKLRTTEYSSHVLWRSLVFEKYNYRCFLTNKQGSLNAHHLNSYHWDIENRFNVDNGVCILGSIHKLFHKLYGNKYNTKEQFDEFKTRYDSGEFGFNFK